MVAPSSAGITRGTTAMTVANLMVGLLVEVKAVRRRTTVTAVTTMGMTIVGSTSTSPARSVRARRVRAPW
jgi:hypothetical protein